MNISCAFQAFGEWIDGCLPSLRKELDRLKWPIFAFCYLSHPTPEFWEDFRHLFVDSYGDAVYELLSSPPPTVVRTDIHLSALAQRLLFAKLEKETLSIDGKTYVSKAPKEQRRERNKENDQSDEHKTKNAKGWSDILLAVNSCFRFHISAAPNFPKSTSPSHPLSSFSPSISSHFLSLLPSPLVLAFHFLSFSFSSFLSSRSCFLFLAFSRSFSCLPFHSFSFSSSPSSRSRLPFPLIPFLFYSSRSRLLAFLCSPSFPRVPFLAFLSSHSFPLSIIF